MNLWGQVITPRGQILVSRTDDATLRVLCCCGGCCCVECVSLWSWCGTLKTHVCTGTTPACGNTCGRGAGTHGDVLNVHTGVFSVPHHTTRTHTTQQPPPQQQPPQQHTETGTESDRERQRERKRRSREERREKREEGKRGEKIKDERRDRMKKKRQDEKEERRWKIKWGEIEMKRGEQIFSPRNVWRRPNPPDELAQKASKKSLSDELFLHLSSKVQNLTVFSIIYMIRIRIFGPGGINSENISGCTVKEGTPAALLQSGLHEKWWADSMECFSYLRRSLVWWEDTIWKTLWRTF